jgi:hypothetical protein
MPRTYAFIICVGSVTNKEGLHFSGARSCKAGRARETSVP